MNQTIEHQAIAPVAFIDPGLLRDGDLVLTLEEAYAGNAKLNWAPSYRFQMTHPGDKQELGRIELRIGNTDHLRLYAGHIGYRVHSAYRGHHYAARGVRLLFDLGRHHRLGTLWVTCNPDNYASRRSCELAGLEFVEIVDVPPDSEMYKQGDRQKCRYRLFL